jgi:hypothetical protein
MQKEAEKLHKKRVRDNEKMKEARIALSRAYDSQSCANPDTCSSTSSLAGRHKSCNCYDALFDE